MNKSLLLLYCFLHSLNAAIQCPINCDCTDNSIHCDSLTPGELNVLYRELTHPTLETIVNLTITRCQLTDLSFLPGFQLLKSLDVSNNQLSRVGVSPSLKLPSVKVINLEKNAFETIERNAFSYFPNAEEVLLGGNRLQKIEWDSFRLFKLRRLKLDHNGLTSMNEHMLRFMPNIEELDLSGNDIWRVQSSDFTSAQKLKALYLSHNRIRNFDYDSFSPLYQLEILDLSYNNFSSIPGTDLRQLMGLRSLNFSGNPISKISSGELTLPGLQIIDLSNCPSLKVIEAAAFSRLPSLHSVQMSHNKGLTFLSPRAFENSSLIFSLDLSNCGLETVSSHLLTEIAQVKIAGNPLDCGCQLDALEQISSTTIVDFSEAKCSTKQGVVFNLSELSSTSLRPSDLCRPEVILPFGDTVASVVGTTHSIYCGSKGDGDVITWTLPNGTILEGSDPIVPSGLENVDYFSSSLYHQTTSKQMRPRLYASSEFLRLDVVVPSDAGVYECSVRRGRYHSKRTIKLLVRRPNIDISVQEIGAHYASLAWNDSLRVQAADRVALHLTIQDTQGIGRRAVQLSLHNPWFTYNVMRLRPNHNYTFCLRYSLIEVVPQFGTSLLSSQNQESPSLLESCVEQATPPLLSFWDQLSWSTIVIIAIISFSILSVFCFHSVYGRLHVWQQAKNRSRMNQSISGQSFVSHSSAGMSNSITYENNLQLSQSTSFCRFSPGSSSDDPNTSRLLTQRDMAL